MKGKMEEERRERGRERWNACLRSLALPAQSGQDTCQDDSPETAQSGHDDKAGVARRGIECNGSRVAQEGTRGRDSRTRYRPRTRDGTAPTCWRTVYELRHLGPTPSRDENDAASLVAVLARTLKPLDLTSFDNGHGSSRAAGARSNSTLRQNVRSARMSRAISVSSRSMR